MPLPGVRKFCLAKSKTTGKPCINPSMPNGRCRLHGGKVLSGAAHPNFRTGVYSKVLPVRMAARAALGQKDPQLLQLRTELALVDSFIADLAEEEDLCLGKDWYKKLKSVTRELWDRWRRDPATLEPCLENLKDLVESRGRRDQVQEQIGRHIDRRQRLSESERKRLMEMQQMITVSEMMILLGHVIKAVTDNVKDRRIQTAISNEIRKILEREKEKAIDAEFVTA